MIIQVGNQKGGCGKSTLAVNLAAHLAKSGNDVIILDADRQATSTNWALDRLESKDALPTVQNVQASENIRDLALDLGRRYEYVIIDTAGRDSKELRTGILAADLLLVPFRPSQPDLDVMPTLYEIITNAQLFNEKLKALAVLSIAPTNPMINEVSEAQDYLSEYADIPLLNTVIRDRKIYRDAMGVGKGVVEIDNPKAIDEITSLWEEIRGHQTQT